MSTNLHAPWRPTRESLGFPLALSFHAVYQHHCRTHHHKASQTVLIVRPRQPYNHRGGTPGPHTGSTAARSPALSLPFPPAQRPRVPRRRPCVPFPPSPQRLHAASRRQMRPRPLLPCRPARAQDPCTGSPPSRPRRQTRLRLSRLTPFLMAAPPTALSRLRTRSPPAPLQRPAVLPGPWPRAQRIESRSRPLSARARRWGLRCRRRQTQRGIRTARRASGRRPARSSARSEPP